MVAIIMKKQDEEKKKKYLLSFALNTLIIAAMQSWRTQEYQALLTCCNISDFSVTTLESLPPLFGTR